MKQDADHTFQQAIIDGVAEPLLVIGKDFRVKLMNQAALDSLSGEPEIPNNTRCYEISHHRERPCSGTEHPCPIQEVRESGKLVTVVHEHYRANGDRRLFEIIAAPFWDADGAFQGIIETMRDITERKQAEDAFHQYAERLRALTAQLTEVAETERQRLARELHDQVGQNLTVLGINLNIIQSQLSQSTPREVRFRLDDSLALVEQTAERIRDVMADLRPPVLDDYGLVAALRWYGDQFAKRTEIPVSVDGEEPIPRLEERVENALFRIAQEALTNVAKHAHATQVKVTLDVDSETLHLIISDDGIGFVPAKVTGFDGYRGWGLLTITERAEAVNGSCQIKSHPSKGTQVIVKVPK